LGMSSSREAETLSQHTGEILSRDVQNMEIQANKGMAALLLPRPIFYPFAASRLHTIQPGAASRGIQALIQSVVSDTCLNFQVSRQVVRIRLKTLGLLSHI